MSTSPEAGEGASATEALMPVKSFAQSPLLDPQLLAPGCLEEGSVPWVLHRLGGGLIPRFLQNEWRGAGRVGRAAWPAPTLMALMLLRWAEGGVKRLTACRRARTDLSWRAAMRLPVSGETPTEKTLREFEGWLLQRSPSCDLPRYRLVHQWLFEMASRGESARRLWMMDSTPMFCFGALRGTVRLLGDGLRGLVRRWARWTRTPLPKLAQDLEIPWVTTKSTKGGLAIDWRDPEARHEVVHRLATDVQRVVEQLLTRRGEVHPSHREALEQRGAALLKVIHDDLEADEQGRLVIASRSTSDRLVSMTDPEARSGRKSQNQPFKGFKLNVLGDLVSGLIASVKVVPGNCGDGGPGQELLRRAHALGIRLSRVLADTAYGGTEDRLAARRLGIELVAPAPPLPSLPQKSGGVLRKHEFAIDFEARRATCPAGVETLMHREVSRGKVMCQQFEWPVADCAA
ncbi:MAG: transposase, partial [Planctomycetota bacterium]